MKQKLKSVLVLLLCSGLWSSCAKELTLDTGDTFVVVECVLTCDSVQHLNLSFTKPKTEKGANPVITEANATLYDVTNAETAGMFKYSGSDWTLPYSPIPGHDYRLEVDVAGYDLVTARVTMPDQVNIESFMAVGPWADSSWWLQRYKTDKYGRFFWGTVFRAASLPERTWISAIYYDEVKHTYSIVEEICTDYPDIDNFNVAGALYEPLFIDIEEVVLNDEVLEYYVCETLAKQPMHRRYIRATLQSQEQTKDQQNDEIFIISGPFYDNFDFNKRGWQYRAGTPLGSKGGILFESLSEEYDRYLIETYHYRQQQSSTDMSSIYVRDNIYSNIEGGVGIFGAKTQQLVPWVMKHAYLSLFDGL